MGENKEVIKARMIEWASARLCCAMATIEPHTMHHKHTDREIGKQKR